MIDLAIPSPTDSQHRHAYQKNIFAPMNCHGHHDWPFNPAFSTLLSVHTTDVSIIFRETKWLRLPQHGGPHVFPATGPGRELISSFLMANPSTRRETLAAWISLACGRRRHRFSKIRYFNRPRTCHARKDITTPRCSRWNIFAIVHPRFHTLALLDMIHSNTRRLIFFDTQWTYPV